MLILLNFLAIFIGYYVFSDVHAIAEDEESFSVKDIDKCRTQTNNWVILNYYGFLAEPAPWKHKFAENIENGMRIILFKSIDDPEYINDKEFLSGFPIIEETDDYIVFGKKDVCLEQMPMTSTYVDRFEENTGIKIDRCEVLLGNRVCGLLEEIQSLIY